MFSRGARRPSSILLRELSLGDLDVKDLRLLDRLHPYDLWHQGLRARVPRHAGLGAAVVVDDGVHGAVVGRHRAQVGDGQPPERDVPQPAALDEQRVEHLVVGRALVGFVLHGLGPRGEQLLGAVGPVEEADGAADVGRAAQGDVGLVGPKVEERDVARPLRPRARQEELRELVELEVDVEVDDGLRRLLDLGQQEDGLDRNRLVSEGLRALGRGGAEDVGSHLGGLAADAQLVARLEQALRLDLVLRREEGDAHEGDLGRPAVGAHEHARRVLEWSRVRLGGGRLLAHVVRQLIPLVKRQRARARSPDGVIGRGVQQRRVHARGRALRLPVVPVGARALALLSSG